MKQMVVVEALKNVIWLICTSKVLQCMGIALTFSISTLTSSLDLTGSASH
jgi:hypothetical protein